MIFAGHAAAQAKQPVQWPRKLSASRAPGGMMKGMGPEVFPSLAEFENNRLAAAPPR